MTVVPIRQRAYATPHNPRRSFALLGVLALLGMIILSTWHDALPHVHASAQTVSVGIDHHDHDDVDDHASSDQDDFSDLVHVAAHVVAQTVAVPAAPVVAQAMISSAMSWGVVPVDDIGSVRPQSLLRPPRI
jgi:hypothetical protein